MLPCCIECPFHAIQAVHLENRIVLAGTIQAQIFGHHGRGDSTILRGGIIDYRFAAEIASPNAGTTVDVSFCDQFPICRPPCNQFKGREGTR